MITLAYPSGIPFDQSNPPLRFYALFILFGGFVALFLSNYHAKQDKKDFNYFYTIFFIAFPAGIIGARIWYYIANFNTEFASQPFYKFFFFWEGGLAIQGGAIGGVLIGIIVALIVKKDTPILRITDYCVPTILVAQAIGRWGNFFNQEVFGHSVTYEAWNFLPSFILDNMQNGSSSMLSGVKLPAGAIAAPLFLVEGVLNVMFYMIITLGYRAVFKKKHYLDGDQTILYFVAYGFIRLCLEPLRNPAFIMGIKNQNDLERSNYKSLIMAIVFIAIGCFLFVMNHLIIYLLKKKNIQSKLHSNYLLSVKQEEMLTSTKEKIELESFASNDSFLNKLKEQEKKNE